MVHRSDLSRVLKLLEAGRLEIAASKLREEMLDRLACEEEGIPGRELRSSGARRGSSHLRGEGSVAKAPYSPDR